jgi:ketosteroid isomerase-like protein
MSGAARAQEYVDAFGKGDLDALTEYFSDNVLWHVAGKHQLSGDYRGREALFDYFAKARELSGGSLRLEPESILASDGHIAMFMRVTGERDGKQLDVLMAEVMKVAPDGKWTEFWAVADDQESVDKFWS